MAVPAGTGSSGGGQGGINAGTGVRTINFAWTESDRSIVNFYKNQKKKQTSPGVSQDLTGTEDYRLKTVNNDTSLPVTFTIQADLNEDFEFDVSSEFNTPDDVLPGIGKIGRYSSLLSGSAAQILNIFQVPTWDKTNPISLSIKPIFYTRRNSILDCLIPAWSLMSLTILKYDADTKSFRTPGVWLGNVGAAMNRQASAGVGFKVVTPPADQPGQEKDAGGSGTAAEPSPSAVLKAGLEAFGKSSNFIKVRVPGIISFTGMLKSCRPTFSRQVTESGGPLWVMLDMKIEGAIPASSVELFSELLTAPGKKEGKSPNTQNTPTTVFT